MSECIVRLHGSLAEHGKEFKLFVDSPAEAIRGLSSQLSGFKDSLEQGNWRVVRNTGEIDETALALGFSDGKQNTMDIIPVVGGGKSGAGKIVAGAALIAAAYFTGGMAAGAAGLLSTAAHAGVMIGAGMMLSGTSQLLTKAPSTSSSDASKNYNFSGPVNTSGQGSAVPRPIGLRVNAGSVVSSAEITTE